MPNKLVTIFSFVLLAITPIYAASPEQPTNSVSFQDIIDKANNGDANTQYNLGIMYYNGFGITENHTEAARWFCESLKKSIPLDKGIYGIPFNATIDEVLVWCKDNNMAIANDTEQTIVKDINEKASYVMGLKENQGDNKQSLQMLEEKLLEIKKSNSNNLSSYGAARENVNIDVLLTKLDTLKNPAFSYAGQKYYLSSIFPNGFKMWVDGKPQFCKDPEITKTTYALMLMPTKKSERMINNGLKQVHISFYSSQGQSPKTYATLGYFGDPPNKSIRAQFNFISKAISEKYDSPPKLFNFEDLTENNTDLYTIIYDDVFLSTGEKWSDSHISFLMWARNIRLFGEIGILGRGEEFEIVLGSPAFGLLYYEPNAIMRLSENYNKAVENFEKEYYKQRKQESTKEREDF
jgi:hypothetical protein